MYILTHSTAVFKSSIFLFFIHPESIIKIKAIQKIVGFTLKKIFFIPQKLFFQEQYFTTQRLEHSLNLLLKKICMLPENTGICLGGDWEVGVVVPCKINHRLYLFISEKVLEGFWQALFFCFECTFSQRNDFINGGLIPPNKPIKVYLAQIQHSYVSSSKFRGLGISFIE